MASDEPPKHPERRSLRNPPRLTAPGRSSPDPDRARYLAILADVLGRVLDELDPRDRSRLSYYYI